MTRHADVVFPRGRIAFVDGTGRKGGDSPGHATAIVLWGATAEEVAAVRSCFPERGSCRVARRSPKG